MNNRIVRESPLNLFLFSVSRFEMAHKCILNIELGKIIKKKKKDNDLILKTFFYEVIF